MSVRNCSLVAATLLVALASLAPSAGWALEKKAADGAATPSQAYKAIPKPDNRRPGELDGWDNSGKSAAEPAKPKKKAAAPSKKRKSAKTDAPASVDATPNGGLPLPSGRGNIEPQSGVGFDDKGNFGTGLKF